MDRAELIGRLKNVWAAAAGRTPSMGSPWPYDDDDEGEGLPDWWVDPPSVTKERLRRLSDPAPVTESRESYAGVCRTCQGDGCEEECGHRGGCEMAHAGPNSHRVCKTCKGSGLTDPAPVTEGEARVSAFLCPACEPLGITAVVGFDQPCEVCRWPERYPHESGDVIVLGPRVFVAKDGSVLNWQGQNYVPLADPVSVADGEADDEVATDEVRPMAEVPRRDVVADPAPVTGACDHKEVVLWPRCVACGGTVNIRPEPTPVTDKKD